MFDSPRHGKHRPWGQTNDALTGLISQRDLHVAVEHVEELVGLGVGMPDKLASDLDDPNVVIVYPGDDMGRPFRGERREGLIKLRWLCRHVSDSEVSPTDVVSARNGICRKNPRIQVAGTGHIA